MIDYTPKSYQQKAIDFAMAHPKSMLALGMGLGKTSVSLYVINQLLQDFEVNRVLIIAPLMVAKDTWPRELQKWSFCAGMSMNVAVGSELSRSRAIESDSDIVVINKENVPWMVQKYGKNWPFDMIIIDESSAFKSSSSLRFKELRKVTKNCSRVIELTGTPRPNSIEDLWPQIYLLDSGERMEKSLSAFRMRYMVAGRHSGYVVYEWKPRKGAEDIIYSRLSDVCMAMESKDWMDVPETTTIDHYVALDRKASSLYKTLCSELVVQVEEGTVVGQNAGVLAGKLLQCANGAVYDDEKNVREVHSGKLTALAEIMESTEEPVLVFYQYQHDYDRIMEEFEAYKPRTVDGPETIAEWNAGRIRMLVCHPAAMGHGLNLQDGGHIIVWFGLTYSLELYQQANARLYRTGQKNIVQIHRLITKDTVDESVIQALDRKDIGQSAFIDSIIVHAKEVVNA